MASSSLPTPSWQPTFELDGMPLLANANIQAWEKGEEGHVAKSLVHSLLLSVDVNAIADGINESIGRRL